MASSSGVAFIVVPPQPTSGLARDVTKKVSSRENGDLRRYDGGVSPSDEALEARIAQMLSAPRTAETRAAAATLAVRGYGPQILGYLRAVLRSDDDGAEAFSRFCEDVWLGIDGYQQRSTFKAWAYTVAWHAALRVAQDPEHKRGRPLLTGESEKLAAEVRSHTAPYLLTANKDRVTVLRQALTPAEQTLLILRIDRDLSWHEIGEVLAAEGEEVGEAALRKRFERIKERLRELAIAEGLLPTDG
jgi:RNA polymerase sigma-70 factor, ECF subfamily